ncbi:pH-sensitive adenylate cyclase [Bradyrhizobium ivorense]|uniref:PH-sensitive adenylate cyclase n=1 Tax=Bradyrhizobium ivorense TaxID=2511166 RepID=A0A508TAW7_9BRAD|nr:adenylate/guanylate cyclase domain-containing protein [Bradyrhizobium ivorense]VIO71381.1 pH-sensitive adenylate cyclase [Bradyrhizobium ivorense]
MADERIERRLAAILAADVAGYSRLMGADEVGTLAALKAIRREIFDPAIARHNGRIVKTTGDGLLVEFASSVDAVTCAMAVQELMAKRDQDQPQITFRIGINVGDVIIDDGDIFGDGVNIAARVESECEPGGVCLSSNALEQIRGKTEFTFVDLGERALKNIDRAVRLYAARSAALPKSAAHAVDASSHPFPDKPSIAVLPFKNISGDSDQEYFADGMTGDIIALLSRTRDFFVIAKSSTDSLKVGLSDPTSLAQQFRVRYILEGSVRKAANRVRVTAQLIEARTGKTLWADRFDRELSDLFLVQDEVTSGIVGAVYPEVLAAEAGTFKRSSSTNLDAWGLVARGMMALATFTRESISNANDLADRASKLDPEFGLAFGLRAFSLAYRSYMQWGSDWLMDARQASQDIKSAVSLQSDDPTVLFLVGGASWFMGRVLPGVPLLERAIQLNPNLAMARALLGLGYASLDRPADGLAQAEIAFRLSPRDPMACQFFAAETLCHFAAGDFSRAIASAQKGLQVNPNSLDNHLYLAAALAESGDQSRAQKQVEQALRIAPAMSLDIISRGGRDAPGWQKYHVALRKAGLPS